MDWRNDVIFRASVQKPIRITLIFKFKIMLISAYSGPITNNLIEYMRFNYILCHSISIHHFFGFRKSLIWFRHMQIMLTNYANKRCTLCKLVTRRSWFCSCNLGTGLLKSCNPLQARSHDFAYSLSRYVFLSSAVLRFSVALAVNAGSTPQRYLKQSPSLFKALRNCFLIPILICSGGSKIFLGLTDQENMQDILFTYFEVDSLGPVCLYPMLLTSPTVPYTQKARRLGMSSMLSKQDDYHL